MTYSLTPLQSEELNLMTTISLCAEQLRDGDPADVAYKFALATEKNSIKRLAEVRKKLAAGDEN